MTILDKIIKQKEIEVAQLKAIGVEKTAGNILSFKDNFSAEKMNIISEIKRASPSKGTINADVNPVAQAKQYEALGASAISVLTDELFFKGSIDDLRAVAEAVNIPVLCKDFMIDEIQIDRAKAAGASIILLIVAALSEERLTTLFRYAKAEGLEVLVEVHDEIEMKIAIKLGADVIGVNNRNLKTFDVDLGNTEKLASLITDPNTILISESGIRLQEDVVQVSQAGATVILVGETLMRSDDLRTIFDALRIPLPIKKAGK